jgi:hypothetical protein
MIDCEIDRFGTAIMEVICSQSRRTGTKSNSFGGGGLKIARQVQANMLGSMFKVICKGLTKSKIVGIGVYREENGQVNFVEMHLILREMIRLYLE